jgi:hypothetical protein
MNRIVGIAVIACISSCLVQPGLAAGKGAPKDLNAYSLRFWPRDTLKAGQTVSQSTPYGTLVCTSTGKVRRHCSLH